MFNYILLASEIESVTQEAIMTAGEVASDINQQANALVDYFTSHVNTFINFGINILIALVIFGIGKLIISLVLKMTNRFFIRTGTEEGVRKFLLSLFKTIMYVILIIIVCDRIGIETSSFIAVIGSAGLALGLSLQGSLANFAGGILILVIKPFVVGDYIIDGGSGKEGTVSKIDLFYTHLTTPDNKKIVIPNGSITNNNLTNVTSFDKRRIDISVGIDYSSDIKLSKSILENVAKSHDKVLKDSEIFVFVASLDESQVTLGLRVWANTEDYWTTYFDLNEMIKLEFDKNGIEIPFKQLDIHMK